MPDGVDAGDPVEASALAADGRLIRGVRWSLVAWSGGTTLLVLVALGLVLYLVAARTLEQQGIAQLEARADETRGFLTGDRPDPEGPGLGFIFGGRSSGTYAILTDDRGEPIGRRDFRIPPGLPIDAGIEAARERGTVVETATVLGQPARIRTERVETRIGPLYIQVIGDRRTEVETLGAIFRVLVIGGAIVVLVAVGVGAVYARRALIPIRESLAAQRLALRRQREFAADASHELRTPLTVVRSSLDYLRRHRDRPVGQVEDALADIDSEVDHLTALVDNLLLLARSDSGAVTLGRESLDLGDVAAEAASALAKPAAAREVTVVVDPEPAIVDGDAARLRQLVMILVDNAIGHSPTGGAVTVSVRAEASAVTLDVADEGPGVRPTDMAHVFDRFWRAPGAPTGGTGLGLAIARWIAERHGGSISVANRDSGGAVFRVRLPSVTTG